MESGDVILVTNGSYYGSFFIVERVYKNIVNGYDLAKPSFLVPLLIDDVSLIGKSPLVIPYHFHPNA